jgi:hypothetical protein
MFQLLDGISSALSLRLRWRHFILRKSESSKRNDQKNYSRQFFHFSS